MVAPTGRRVRALLNSRLLRYWTLLLPAEAWEAVGAEHPFGRRCGGVADIIPERYDRATLDDAVCSVPPEVTANAFLVGTPAQVTAQLRQFGEVGLRHVVLVPLSALVRMSDFAYAAWAIRRIASSLRSDRHRRR